jgi:hypothetical protein
MTVTDVWRLSQYHKLITSKKDEDSKNVLKIKQFTGVLAKQLIKIAMSCENEADFWVANNGIKVKLNITLVK